MGHGSVGPNEAIVTPRRRDIIARIIHAIERADDALLDLEELVEEDLDRKHDDYQELASAARSKGGGQDEGGAGR